jgi:UDP-N-acetyl-D-mannosaminuronic acid transferase (WecB/TagA/CpsF family)
MTVTTRLPLELCGIRIQRLRYDESLVLAEATLDADKLSRLYLINAHCINTAAANPAYRDAVASAEFVWNDGVGLELAGVHLERRSQTI